MALNLNTDSTTTVINQSLKSSSRIIIKNMDDFNDELVSLVLPLAHKIEFSTDFLKENKEFINKINHPMVLAIFLNRLSDVPSQQKMIYKCSSSIINFSGINDLIMVLNALNSNADLKKEIFYDYKKNRKSWKNDFANSSDLIRLLVQFNDCTKLQWEIYQELDDLINIIDDLIDLLKKINNNVFLKTDALKKFYTKYNIWYKNTGYPIIPSLLNTFEDNEENQRLVVNSCKKYIVDKKNLYKAFSYLSDKNNDMQVLLLKNYFIINSNEETLVSDCRYLVEQGVLPELIFKSVTELIPVIPVNLIKEFIDTEKNHDKSFKEGIEQYENESLAIALLLYNIILQYNAAAAYLKMIDWLAKLSDDPHNNKKSHANSVLLNKIILWRGIERPTAVQGQLADNSSSIEMPALQAK